MRVRQQKCSGSIESSDGMRSIRYSFSMTTVKVSRVDPRTGETETWYEDRGAYRIQGKIVHLSEVTAFDPETLQIAVAEYATAVAYHADTLSRIVG